MTINSVTKMWSRSGGEYESDDGRKFKVAFVEGWQVSHSEDALEPEIISAPGLPLMRDLYPGTFAKVKKIGQSQRLGPCFSIVPVQYGGEIGPGGLNDSPINNPPVIKWRSRRSTEPVDRDFYGRPIMTVNNEPVEGVSIELVDQTLTVSRNFATFTPAFIQPYYHATNSDFYQNYEAGTAKLINVDAESQEANGFSYWSVTAQIDFRFPYATVPARAWYNRRRHEGYYERIGSLLTFTPVAGGTGAGGHAVVNSSGVITDVVVTNGGNDYNAPPTVAAADGTGATFSASLQDGKVLSVAVTAGGTGYKTRLVRAVDDQKEPTHKPVLLKLDGSRERNANNAVWFEDQLYGYLPYAALGLV